MRPLPNLLLLATLGACTQQHINGGEAGRSTYIVIGFQPPDTCWMRVGGKTFFLDRYPVATDAALKRELAIHPDAHLVADPDLNIPYKCLGGAIVEAQRAGFKRIGFISQPPPANGDQ